MDFQWTLITETDQLSQLREDFGRHQLFGFDFETTDLRFDRGEVHGMGLATPDQAWYVTMPVLQELMPWVKEQMERPDVQSVGHNTKFDLHFLKKLDPTIKPANLVDTMVAQWLVNENERMGLKHLAGLHLQDLDYGELRSFKDLLKITKVEMGVKRMDQVTIYDIDLQLLGEYGAKDPWLGVQMWPKLQWLLAQEEQYDHFFNIEMPFVYVLQRMEETGFYLYEDKLHSLKEEWTEELASILDEWNGLTQSEDYPEGRNPASNPQLVEWFYNILDLPVSFRTGKKTPSTKALAIMRLANIDDTGSAGVLNRYRKLSKLISTYLKPFEKFVYNGYIYGSYNQVGTVTGRLASSGPNLQNIPIHGEFGGQVRYTLGAPPGYDYLMIDYSQIELRLAAHYGQVPALMDAFLNGIDVHQRTADLVGVERFIAKNLNFAWFYGAGPRKFCDMVEEKGYERPQEKQAKDWFYGFGQAYPELVDWKFAVLRAGRDLGYIRTIMRRRRHLPELDSYDSSMRSQAERQAVNSVIQGSAGDLIKYAMLKIDPLLESYDAHMNSQTHDELGFIVPKSVSKEFALMVQEKMVSVEGVFNLTVPVLAEYTLGQTWGDTKEKE